MWPIVMSASGTLAGGLLATLGIARHRLSKSHSDNKESFGGGSLGSLIRAVGQMIAVHLFDRIE